MEACTWDLEPEFTHQHEGKTINVVLTTVVYQPGHHLCKTLLREQQGLTDCILQRGHPRHTVLQGVLQRRNGQWWITMSHDTRTFCRPDPEMSGLYRIVDACSGIGAVATGFEQTGAEIICHVEGNEQFCQWKSSRSSVPCIRGDVNHVQTIHAVAKHTQWSHTLSAGISCQPFSKLGDERQEKDPRSASLPGTLLMGYFLGSIAIILECTQEAGKSDWVQNQLQAFASQIGFTMQQTVLMLHETWPARRTRWWAILAHAALCIRPIKKCRFCSLNQPSSMS